MATVTRIQVANSRQLAFMLIPKNTFCLVRESIAYISCVRSWKLKAVKNWPVKNELKLPCTVRGDSAVWK